MKNKEIEELLNSIDKIIKEAPDEAIYGIQIKEYKQIKNHIEQLENKNKENNLLLIEFQDMEQKIEQPEKENEFLRLDNPNANIKHFEMLKENKRKIDNLRYQNKQLQNNRDKAIKYLEEKYERPISYYCCIKEALKILKGDSDE